MDARRALLTGLIDHAPLFPPARLAMPEALEEDRRFRSGSDGWLVRRFVVPASRLAELGDVELPLAVVVDGPHRDWADDPRVEAVETMEPELAGGGREVFVEVPAGQAGLQEHLGRLARSGRRAKVRCGGARVPTVAELADFIRGCRELSLPFKATAGLHHAVRAGAEHGFLNVAAAALFGNEEEALGEEDPSAFGLTAERFSWRARSAAPPELARLRAQRFCGFGSCSAQEPADELRALGFLP